MSKTVTMRIDESVLEKFNKFAQMENRTLSNFIETATLKYINEIELTDRLETKEILENEELIEKIKRGHADAKSRKGKFVKV